MKTNAGRWHHAVPFLFLTLAVAVPVSAQEKPESSPSQVQSGVPDDTRPAASPAYAPGQKVILEGVVAKREADGFTLRTFSGSTVVVSLSANTEVKERKSNPFRRAHNYAVTQLLPGLDVEVKGHGSNTGSVVADEVRFRSDDLRIAASMDSRVAPLEARLKENEQNALRLSGQVSELSAVSNAARGGAKAAQETADTALDSAKKAGESADRANETASNAKEGVRVANERISSIDDFDVRGSTTVNFKAGSAILSEEAKESLDKVAENAKNEKGFVIEVAGFASADGKQDYNRTLSQHRADAVIRYLAENHSIPLRRFITPFGYGAKQPVADNKTRAGRMQNRRVEVHILVSKGLTQPPTATTAATH
jgi:outer membrane protein OmpA-like peptidoglycan-associated protein